MLSPELEQQIKTRHWPLVEKFITANIGFGLRATRDIPKGVVVVSYGGEIRIGGTIQSHQYKYLLEYRFGTGQNNVVWFNHPEADDEESTEYFSIGKFINHSRLHPNLKGILCLDQFHEFHLIFETLEPIVKNQELSYTYGYLFPHLNSCLQSCLKCIKKKAKTKSSVHLNTTI